MLLLFALCLIVAVGLLFTPGVGLLAVIPLVIAVAFGAWIAVTFISGKTPGRAVRETKHPTLLGPGGPDDPEA